MDSKLWKRLDAITKAFQAEKSQDLKQIGNDSIEEAAIESSPEMANLSVIAYCLYKMSSKNHFVRNRKWDAVKNSILLHLHKSRKGLEKENFGKFKKNLHNVINSIQKIDHELSNYARDLHEKAKIKQASTAYASGVSLSQAAALTGADKKEVQRYIGITRIHDEQEAFYDLEERLKKLKELLAQ